MLRASIGLVLAMALPAAAAPAVDPQAILGRHVEDRRGGTAIVAVVIDPGAPAAERRVYAHGRSRGRPADAHTLFEIGSITKVFTSLLLADMVRRGEVTLETTIGDLLPAGSAGEGLAAATAGVTLRELATHTSGLPRLPRSPDMAVRVVFRRDDPYAGTTIEGLFRALGTTVPVARSETAYSNFGVALLGQLLAARAGRPYTELLEKRILRPLGLEDTWTDVATAPRPRLARGYAITGRPADHWHLGAYAPAGGLVSSAAEMASFVERSLEAGEPSWRFRSPGDAAAEPVRLGWLEDEIGERTLIWHNGGTGGFRSFIGLLPEEGRGAVVLSNGGLSVDALGRWLLGDESLPEPPPTPVFWSVVTAVMMLVPPLGLAGAWVRSRRARRTPRGAGRTRRGAFRSRWQFLATLAGYAFIYGVFVPWGTWVVLPHWTAYVSAGLAAALAAFLLPEIRSLEWRGSMRPFLLALAIFATIAYTALAVALLAW